MLQIFYPDEYLDSAYSIDYEEMYRRGYRGIIYDIDNTLVTHGAPHTQQSLEHFSKLKELGFSCIVISNNKEPRVKSFAEQVDIPYIYKAAKPRIGNYLKAMDIMGTDKSNTFFVGDQIFTDVWGAKRAGIYSILTKPIHPKEEIQIVLKRKLEWFVIRSFQKKQKTL